MPLLLFLFLGKLFSPRNSSGNLARERQSSFRKIFGKRIPKTQTEAQKTQKAVDEKLEELATEASRFKASVKTLKQTISGPNGQKSQRKQKYLRRNLRIATLRLKFAEERLKTAHKLAKQIADETGLEVRSSFKEYLP